MGEGGGVGGPNQKRNYLGGCIGVFSWGVVCWSKKKSPDLRSPEVGISAVCSVNSDILLTVHVAFIILQKLDFSRLALDVYVSTRYGYNIKQIQIQRGHNKAMVIVHFPKFNKVSENPLVI